MNDDAYWYSRTAWRPLPGPSGRLVKLPPKIGNGGPGTVYTATAFEEATAKHGRPFGLFDSERQLQYKG